MTTGIELLIHAIYKDPSSIKQGSTKYALLQCWPQVQLWVDDHAKTPWKSNFAGYSVLK